MKAPAYCIAAVSFLLACMLASPLYAQESDLILTPDDLVIEQSLEGGYYLYIRAKKGIGSVLLTESTAHPDRRVDSYAFQNPKYHPANGNEIRMLDGKILDPAETGRYFLVDSSPEPHPQLGSAFRIFIPYVVQFGYEWSRNGKIQILDGSWFNIRTFSLPYADYEGSFVDNPFVVRVIQHPLPPPEPVEPEEEPDRSRYMKEALEAYEEISENGEGEIIYGKGEGDLIGDIKKLIDKADGDSLDLVLCLDTTKSMENDIPHLKTSLIPMLKEVSGRFARFRFGLVLYRDYYEEYLTKTFPFQEDFSSLQRVLSGIRVFGGRDIPEAVYEALYAGIHEYPWSGDAKMIILVGDAPPHPMPRGRVTKELVYTDAEAAGIELNVIILPQ